MVGPEDAERAIRQASDQVERCARAGDAEGMLRAYADDAWVIPPGQPMVRGREQVGALLRAAVAGGGLDLAIETLSIQALGDLAYRVGRYRMGGAAGRFLGVWRREADGAWRCVAEMFDAEPPNP
jgi:uncharacterized protein (TIGR02246 family)